MDIFSMGHLANWDVGTVRSQPTSCLLSALVAINYYLDHPLSNLDPRLGDVYTACSEEINRRVTDRFIPDKKKHNPDHAVWLAGIQDTRVIRDMPTDELIAGATAAVALCFKLEFSGVSMPLVSAEIDRRFPVEEVPE